MPETPSIRLRQCPVCKKADPLAGSASAPACPRCGCDLTKSAAAHAAALHHLISAAAALRARDYGHALEHAAYGWSLARLPAFPPVGCLAAAGSRRPADLALWQSRGGNRAQRDGATDSLLDFSLNFQPPRQS